MFRLKLPLLPSLLLLITGLWSKSYGQNIIDPVLKNIVKATASSAEMKPIEKLYLQTDKPYYMAGDTMRLKAYLLNADYFNGSSLSGLLYVGLYDESGKTIKRVLLPVVEGLAWGDIALDSTEIPKGNYTLRAYTNWMRNFGEDYIFKKNVTISQYENNPLLVSTAFKQAGEKIEGEIRLGLLDGRIQAFKDIDLGIFSGKRNLAKDKVVTGIDGSARFNFTPPEGIEKAALTIKAKVKDNPDFIVRVNVNRAEETDIQFMPEGGTLVSGLPATVGVKAISEDGKGVNIKGNIINSKGEHIASINTLHKGMGRFTFTPLPGERYSAKLDGINKVYPLPKVNSNGSTLAVKSEKDSLKVTVAFSSTIIIDHEYYLIGQARNVVCYAEKIDFQTVRVLTKTVAKGRFPTGVVHFTLMNSNYQPLNERIVFIDHHDQLTINIDADKPAYSARDSVGLKIKVKDKNGNPISGSFSVAVTDDSQVKTDSLGSNILNSLLLTSDLKGEIENPAYYFKGDDKDIELDNLMLTQGWIGYDWQAVIHPKYPLMYKPETEFSIRGKVVNAFGKPVDRSNVILLAGGPALIVKDTLTDQDGRFIFKNLFPIDTAIFKLQARNKRNKEFNVGIEMDVTRPPEFKSTTALQPWFVNTDSTLLSNMKIKTQEKNAQATYLGEGTRLKEVNIKAKKTIPGSKNLNGPGQADLIIDAEELNKADKKTLFDLLRERLTGLMEHGIWRPCETCKVVNLAYTLNFKRVHFVFDGMQLDFFYRGGIDRYNFIKTYLDYYTAEDITGIEVMNSSKYAGSYISSGQYASAEAYVEITTRSKQGPFMKVTPGTYLYRTLAFSLPKQFYRPRYTIANRSQAIGTDLRSTIHWEPNLITDTSGNATLSFYTADKTGDYTIIIEGTDLNGQLGYQRRNIRINK
jgi:hypothetical protein